METSSRPNPADRNQACCTWPASWRFAASLFLTLHVGAVFVGAFSVPPVSALGERARAVLRPYIEAADLDHGYRFFNVPGPSHLVRYELEFDDGRDNVTGVLPHRQEHWPRLRYHRHFMLTESLNRLYEVAPQPPRGSRPGDDVYEQWRRARDELNRMADVYVESYARHLLAAHGASRVTLWGQQRELPSIDDVRDGVRLGDPRFLNEVRLGVWEARR